MAVYTELNEQQIRSILSAYDVGELSRFEPIESGIENTNYFIWTERQAYLSVWVLTIFENIPEESLPFFNTLTCFLSGRGFFVPAPIKSLDGKDVFVLESTNLESSNRKFGVLVPKFAGKANDIPEIVHCTRLGEFMAKMHVSLAEFSTDAPALLQFSHFEKRFEELRNVIPSSDLIIIERAMIRLSAFRVLLESCLQGVVHGDLFRDNVLFENDMISGVIDFYNAGKTAVLFDLAVAVNDWAVSSTQLSTLSTCEEYELSDSLLSRVYDEEKVSAILNGYQSIRVLSQEEKAAWPKMMALAAFRFYMSRLKTKYLSGYQQEVKAGNAIKSPNAMKVLLLASMNRSPLA